MAKTRDEKGNLIVSRKKNELINDGSVGNEIGEIISITEQVLANPEINYPNDEIGYEAFKNNSISYLEYIRQVNASGNLKTQIIPDIEGWTNYIGITKKKLQYMEKSRSEKWASIIDRMKNGISACKKQLALNGQLPTVMAIFDLSNNHGYVNASEFKVSKTDTVEQRQALTVTEIKEKYGGSGEMPVLPVDEE